MSAFNYSTVQQHPAQSATIPTSLVNTSRELETSVAIIVRAMQPSDEPQAEALWEGVSPYRPSDEAEIEAMYERATRAREAGSRRWKKPETQAPHDVAPNASASWIAAVPLANGEDRVVGTVQVTGPTAFSQMPSDLPLCREWRLQDHVAELSRLRVADDMWRQGIGTRLTRKVIDWCRDRGFRTLVLNTTTPQKPAIALYKKLGFREADRTFLGKYELVWLSLQLSGLQSDRPIRREEG